MLELSESEEEYLEALYRHRGKKEKVRTGVLSKDLGVKEPSVVEMLKKLDKKELVNYEKYSGATLTEKGENKSFQVLRKHRLAERLLCDVLDRDLPDVHEEACRLEHSLEDVTADKIENVLKNPKTCPHGNPIPRKNNDEEEVDLKKLSKLSECKPDEKCQVVTIPEKREYIRKLLSLGILPGSKVEITENPSVGALMIQRNGDKLALSREIASKIKVKSHEKRKRRRHRNRSGG